MGEAKRRQMAVDTPGGRIHVQRDHGASATPNAQLTFFAGFLATTGVYDAWGNSCPLNHTSPNAHSKRGVLGTWLLGVLAGHNRYALHTYWVGNLHRVLDVVSPGKAHSAAKARPGLIGVLEQLTPEQRPALV